MNVFSMTELYTEHEGTEVCPVCHVEIADLETAIKFIDSGNQEEYFFDKDECYKDFLENPDAYREVSEEETEE